jgi:hypothetical protein
MNAKTMASQAAFVAAATLLAQAQSSLAAQPQFHTLHFDRTIIDTRLCGFPIQVHDEGDVRIAFHFDKSGNIEWVNVTTSNYRITLSNTANGISLWTPSPEHIIETAFDTTNSGLVIRFVMPQVGLLTLDAGRVVFDNSGDVSVSGPHMLLEGDVEALCTAMAAG